MNAQLFDSLSNKWLASAGPFVGFTVTAALVASLVLDHFGWFHMPVHAINLGRILGAALMIGGITLIARY
jgi:transporter family-2 protein